MAHVPSKLEMIPASYSYKRNKTKAKRNSHSTIKVVSMTNPKKLQHNYAISFAGDLFFSSTLFKDFNEVVDAKRSALNGKYPYP